jgi:hypothetical protein
MRSGQLAKALEQARDHVAAAESLVRTAKDAKRTARQKKRLAKEELRSAKKHLKQAKAKLVEANEHLADAEKKLAKEVKHAPKSRKPAKGHSTARSSSSSHKIRRINRAPSTRAKASKLSAPAEAEAQPPAATLAPTDDGVSTMMATSADQDIGQAESEGHGP